MVAGARELAWRSPFMAARRFFFFLPRWLDAATNMVVPLPPPRDDAASSQDAAAALLRRSLLADAHGDTLLWGTRPVLGDDARWALSEDGVTPLGLVSGAAAAWQAVVAPRLPPGIPYVTAPAGHADVSRLRGAGVGLATWAVVTTSPWGMNAERNDDPTWWGSDRVGVKAALELWPPWAAASRLGRVLYQARRLHAAVRDGRGHVVQLRWRRQLAMHVDKWRGGRESATATAVAKGGPELNESVATLGVILGVEGAQCLDGRLGNIDVLHSVGVRVLGLSHFHDTPAGGSAAGREQGGLTPWGRSLLRRAVALGMVVDLAHASTALLTDVLALPAAERPPVMISHTGFSALCPSPRNVDDDTVRAVVAAGGVVGVTFFDAGGCVGRDYPPGSPGEGAALFAAVVDAVVHAVSVAGPRGVVLGSDWDGAVRVAIGPGELERLAAALLERGMEEAVVEGVMGENYVDFLQRSLP
ncbi:hypothetical protein MMPV_008921 [Pyropia vietnamensis]